MRVAGLQWQVTLNRELSRPCHRRINLVVVSKRQAGSDRGLLMGLKSCKPCVPILQYTYTYIYSLSLYIYI